MQMVAPAIGSPSLPCVVLLSCREEFDVPVLRALKSKALWDLFCVERVQRQAGGSRRISRFDLHLIRALICATTFQDVIDGEVVGMLGSCYFYGCKA
jgi:MFS superfamily sulfate permease-like transporter